MTNTYRFKVANEVEVFTKSELIDEANDLREFLNVDGYFIDEATTAEQAITILEKSDRVYLDR